MKFIILFIFSVFHLFLMESQAVYTRLKFDRSDEYNHLSSFHEALNDVFTKNHIPLDIKHLFEAYVKSDFQNGDGSNIINFSSGTPNLIPPSESGDEQKNPFESRVAECFFSTDENFKKNLQKFYIPLKDVEIFLKTFEFSKNLPENIKVFNYDGKRERENRDKSKRELFLKCNAVDLENVKDNCKVCLYHEEVVNRRHFRFGNLFNCEVSDCMNGYDEEMRSSSNNGYFFFDLVKYHPMCVT